MGKNIFYSALTILLALQLVGKAQSSANQLDSIVTLIIWELIRLGI